MGKKCIPGLFCVENMTLFIVFVLLILITYAYYVFVVKPSVKNREGVDGSLYSYGGTNNSRVGLNNPTIVVLSSPPLVNTSSDQRLNGTWTGPFPPPENSATLAQIDSIQNSNAPFTGANPNVFGPNTTQIRRPIYTHGLPENYSQIGVLTRLSGSGDMILPLMGRRSTGNRSKYQYYTFSNSGNLNSRLPVSVNGKSCTSEYGCDEISNGDIVYVDGYNDTFRATIYEEEFFSYNPFR